MPARTIAVGAHATSYPALAWAIAEAGAWGARLAICHVCDPDSALVGRDRVPPGLLELANPPLARAVAAARDHIGGQRVSLSIATGHIGEALVRAADGADLLVVGAPEHTGWAQRRSTTHYAVQHARVPIVVVRTASTAAHGPFAGHVVVGVDGSPQARAALAFGFGWAAEHRRPMVAVHVTDRQQQDAWLDESRLETHLVAEPAGLDLLADEIAPWHNRYPDVRVKRAMFAGPVHRGLSRAAAGAILLAVGTRGLGLAARAVLGSVSHAAVDGAPCPVAVVPAVDGDGRPQSTVPVQSVREAMPT
jgi:nucleotide-binding universal stress UspA family protein